MKLSTRCGGIELLKGLMELHGLKQLDLVPIFKTKSIVSAVLNGKRQLTVEHINKLAGFFKVSHELFFESLDAEKVGMLMNSQTLSADIGREPSWQLPLSFSCIFPFFVHFAFRNPPSEVEWFGNLS